MSRELYQTCPHCNSEDMVDIAYGSPSEQTRKRANQGEIVLGGCIVHNQSPILSCRNCGARIGSIPEKTAYQDLQKELEGRDEEEITTYLFELAIDEDQTTPRRKVAIKLMNNAKKLLALRLLVDESLQPTIKIQLKKNGKK